MKIFKIFLALIVFSGTFLGCSTDDKDAPIVVIATPLVEFSYAPSEVRAGQEVSFNGRFLTGSSVITSWVWNFGDEAQSTVATQNATFTFPAEGVYTVSLTASDKLEASTTVTQEITVLEPVADPFEASVVWSFSTENVVPNYNDGSSSPAIAEDGTIYYLEAYAAAESRMIAVTDNGTTPTKVWEYVPGYNIRNAPAIGPDGHIYIGIWALDAVSKVNAADGTQLWLGTTGTGISNSTAAIDASGNVYIGTRNQGIISFDANGAERWKFQEVTGTGYYGSPVLSVDGATLYAIKTNGLVYAINAADGTSKWTENIAFEDNATGTSLALNSDGTVYYTTDAGVTAITDNGTTGSVKWSTEVAGANNSGIVIGLDGNLYVGGSAGLAAINPETGDVVWHYEATVNESVPAVDSEGNVYVGTSDGKLIVVNALGELLKQLNLTSGEVNSPTIADDGTVYIEGYNGSTITLFKITTNKSEGPADSFWPMKGKNKRNTSFSI
ncbi:outer membrane protein assembly factor BamB family protein [Aestuariibaculum marinum]|uniref:PQQ-binding-like beta-propeller repeat protein n=1 Tax=Aestuariibaculum marinum TaxID=2683592 RepID=A0A8J6Q0M3_9FLAO|nr:PQQ-binding-like beta-propeller repeat protein [Aestuariibaculum marinum]MBD0825466.1 PQQ-binding-like beta-propeller repeat protein [Aestuariibaculum marinum]